MMDDAGTVVSTDDSVKELPTTAVLCGCRPCRPKRRKKASRRPSQRSVYFDPEDGDIIPIESDDLDSQYFFDAEEEELEPNEYPIIITNYIKEKPDVSMQRPESLLLKVPSVENSEEESEITELTEAVAEDEAQGAASSPSTTPPPLRKSLSKNHFLRRPTIEAQKNLQNPRVPVQERGYPGCLTPKELEECNKFIQGLKKRPELHEIVYSMSDLEDEPYTICRFLRATKFSAEAILNRLDTDKPLWFEAKTHDFYPEISNILGCPYSVFLEQYPFVPLGRAKNGCPVNYFKAGRIQPEGIMCLTTLDRVPAYFWNQFVHDFKPALRQSINDNPNFVRCEGVNIIDLKGLSASALSSETMEVIKIAGKVSDFFPETLHCLLILNAPSFFSMSWGLIKKFIDPRTASKIQVFSNEEKGLEHLYKLIDKKEIPADYGGERDDIKTCVLRRSGQSKSCIRQDVELLFIKKNGKASYTCNLKADEKLTLQIYSRSASSATFTLSSGTRVVQEVTVKPTAIGEDAAPGPCCKRVVVDLKGPGCLTLQGVDNNDVAKHHATFSRGYFLVVGDVNRLT